MAREDDDGIIELVKAYAKQETLGPLKGAGRWLAFGAAGALLLGLGLFLILLGGLRFLQTKFDTTFDGAWSWAPYFIVAAVAGLVLALAFSRVKQPSLHKEPH
jgi:MFS family permease